MNSRNNQFGNHRARISENNLKIVKFGSEIMLCVVGTRKRGRCERGLEESLESLKSLDSRISGKWSDCSFVFYKLGVL